MKNSLMSMVAFFCFSQSALAQGGFEQYSYISRRGALTFVPILHYQTFTNWYVEGRYNYEAEKSFSIYGGRIFSKQGRFSFSITPMLGGVFGQFKGGSGGLNITMDMGKFFFASQSQVTISSRDEQSDFFFNWSELAYQPSKWVYAGLALQHTRFLEAGAKGVEPGVVVGLSFGLWTFPLYVFSPLADDRYFIAGINLRLGTRIVETHLK